MRQTDAGRALSERRWSGWLVALTVGFALVGEGCFSKPDESSCKNIPDGSWMSKVVLKGSTGGVTSKPDIAVDRVGNSYVTGGFEHMATFGSTVLTTKENFDLYVAKLNPSGKFVWSIAARGDQRVIGSGVAVDNAGNVYVTGVFAGTLSFGSTRLATNSYGSLFVAKLSPDGRTLWAATSNGSSNGDSAGVGIAVDDTGNCYVTGSYSGQTTLGSTTLTAGLGEIFVAKLNPTGTFLWAASAGIFGKDSIAGIAVDRLGNSYVTGHFQDKATFGTTTLAAAGGYHDVDLFIAKLDPAGKFLWAVSAGGGPRNGFGDWGSGIAVDKAGNSYVTGGFQGPANFGSTTLASDYDMFVTKLNTNGNFLWAISTGGSENIGGNDIAVDSAGDCYVTGGKDSYQGKIGVSVLSPGCNVFVAKVSAGGKFVWAESAEGGGGTSIAVDQRGNSYTAGPTERPFWNAIGYGTQPRGVFMLRIPAKP